MFLAPVTLYTQLFRRILVYTAPTPKKDLILYKIALSLICNNISNETFTLFSAGNIMTVKQPSASTKPVTQLGSSLF